MLSVRKSACRATRAKGVKQSATLFILCFFDKVILRQLTDDRTPLVHHRLIQSARKRQQAHTTASLQGASSPGGHWGLLNAAPDYPNPPTTTTNDSTGRRRRSSSKPSKASLHSLHGTTKTLCSSRAPPVERSPFARSHRQTTQNHPQLYNRHNPWNDSTRWRGRSSFKPSKASLCGTRKILSPSS